MSKDDLLEDLKAFRTPICKGVDAKIPYPDELADYLARKGYCKIDGENVATYPSSSFECSNCHWQDWDLLTADSAYNFCPHCGAKLKGGE